MNETSFWQLIDQAGSQEEPNEWLRDALLKKKSMRSLILNLCFRHSCTKAICPHYGRQHTS